MSNMEAFNEITAKALSHLLTTFPRGTRLLAKDFIDGSSEDEVMIFHFTIAFLGTENLIRYEGASDDGTFFFEVILTAKGLTALNAIPDVLEEKKTFSQKMSGALKSGSKEVLKSVVNQFIVAVATGRIHFLSQV
jgi:hypothetical protein